MKRQIQGWDFLIRSLQSIIHSLSIDETEIKMIY